MTKVDNDTAEGESSEVPIRRIPVELLYAYRDHPSSKERPEFENETFWVLKGIIRPKEPRSSRRHSC